MILKIDTVDLILALEPFPLDKICEFLNKMTYFNGSKIAGSMNIRIKVLNKINAERRKYIKYSKSKGGWHGVDEL